MNRIIKNLAFLFLVLLVSATAFGQKKSDESIHVVQFSGLVVTEDTQGELEFLPYTNIAVKGTARGTVSDLGGYFSLPARVGETVVFSHLGYETVEFTIPDTLRNNFYSFIQIMTQDSVLLPMAVIRPWPSKEFFEIEFLALDVSDEMRERAKENLAEEALASMRDAVPGDGFEAGNIYLREQAAKTYYDGQLRPQKIFDLAAWAKFIEAWKRGDFKKKKDN